MKILEISSYNVGDEITDLRGWVDTVRHHGGLLFFDLRDYNSTVQIVTDKPDDFLNHQVFNSKLGNNYKEITLQPKLL